jgi:hypothetical protein
MFDLTLKLCPCGSSNVNVIDDFSPEYGWIAYVTCGHCNHEVFYVRKAEASPDVAKQQAVVAWNASQLTE